jgi:Asp-tRNA(Asn)/Glu-tRNA(Gln) amidotransferase A subunit family amidase
LERRGGATLMGKTNNSLMGFCGTCNNDHFVPTRKRNGTLCDQAYL